MTEVWAPPDQAARDRIRVDLQSTLFVEAGAGSGKTTALIDRVVALVTSGTAELRSIAAITFTEKAGLELRDRLRRELRDRADAADDLFVAGNCQAALDQLDGAAIGTLHAFAQRLLSEHPIEAGLPPRVEVLDEVSSGVEFERRWGAYRDELLADPALERSLLVLLAAGARPEALDALARAFEDNWDLVADRVSATADEPPPVRVVVEPVIADLDSVVALRADCRIGADLLAKRLDDLAAYAERLRATDNELELVEALGGEGPAKPPSFKAGNVGRAQHWPDISVVRGAVTDAGASLASARGAIANACARRIASAIRTFTLTAAGERRAAGRLAFHDLLVLARALLRDETHGPAVRARLHRRYERILLDEFQDTDPIQIELAVRIAAAVPEADAAGTAPWDAVPVAAGHLFVVGDPKQSIYRFRRADIATFQVARDRFGPDGGGVVPLTANFRTAPDVIDWVNHVFGALMSEPADVDVPVASQPTYVALDAVRPAAPVGPAVAVVGRDADPARAGADELRAREALDVAAAAARIVAEGWSVDDGAGGWRPARLGDVCILLPARTSLPFLQDALDGVRIPYRAESSSLVYATRAVRDLLMVLRSVNDPTNHLHTLSALRTPLFGCGDDDLFRYRVERGGAWNYLAEPPPGIPDDDPVLAGLGYLRVLHTERYWMAPSELLDRIARDRRAFELGFADTRPRDVWRRLRFVIDQARAWSEATAGSLRQYLHWVDTQTAEGARVAEAVLPETDDDAVRLMTIHAAKGLEFPITIVSGLTTVPQSLRAAAEVVFPPTGAVGYRFGGAVATPEFEAWKPIDEQMALDERVRLLYVACTRARDHLVVSLHRNERAKQPEPARRTNAELLVDGMGLLLATLPDAVAPVAALVPPPPAPPPPLPAEAVWRDDRDSALAVASRPSAVAATALTEEGVADPADDLVGGPLDVDDPAAGLQKRPRDLDLPPWLKGRYGTAIGRAVHGTLQTVDLGTGAGLDAAVAAQCEAEAIPDQAAQVGELVRAALRSPSVQEAAGREHWREVYACTPVDGRLLEGYVDLLYRADDGLVVVDHKTAATTDPAELDRRVDGYRLQGASYALAVAAATGEEVSRVTFLFLTPDGPVERHLDGLDDAVARVGELVTAGRELTVE